MIMIIVFFTQSGNTVNIYVCVVRWGWDIDIQCTLIYNVQQYLKVYSHCPTFPKTEDFTTFSNVRHYGCYADLFYGLYDAHVCTQTMNIGEVWTRIVLTNREFSTVLYMYTICLVQIQCIHIIKSSLYSQCLHYILNTLSVYHHQLF